jgi:hypothetical protein
MIGRKAPPIRGRIWTNGAVTVEDELLTAAALEIAKVSIYRR